MYSVEQTVKQQFARVFRGTDWYLFKSVADCYLRQAAFLRKRHVVATSDLALLIRNSQKRLLIGIGSELVLKALYLKLGYVINKPVDRKHLKGPITLNEAAHVPLERADTFTLSELIDWLGKVIVLSNKEDIDRGLRTAKVFRNKEAHVVTATHAFKISSYRHIELALRELYRQAFNERLSVRFSLGPTDRPMWRISLLG
jgi:hypothetical protein